MDTGNIMRTGSASDLLILEVMDTVEATLEKFPESSFSFGILSPAEAEVLTTGLTKKVLIYAGNSALDTAKVLSNLYKSYSVWKNFKNFGVKELAKIGVKGAALVLYLM